MSLVNEVIFNSIEGQNHVYKARATNVLVSSASLNSPPLLLLLCLVCLGANESRPMCKPDWIRPILAASPSPRQPFLGPTPPLSLHKSLASY